MLTLEPNPNSGVFTCLCSVADKGYIIDKNFSKVKEIPPPLIVEHPETSSYRYYDPLELVQNAKECPLLLGQLAEMEPTEENIIAFSNKYGLLSGETYTVALSDVKNETVSAMSLRQWKQAQYDIACALTVWEWLEKRDIAKLGTYITWRNDLGVDTFFYRSFEFPPDPEDIFPGLEWKLSLQAAPLAQITESGFPADMLFERDFVLSDVIGIGSVTAKYPIDRSQGFETLLRNAFSWHHKRFKPGDVFGPAQYSLISLINKKLSAHGGGPRVIKTHLGKFEVMIVPQSLLGAIWLQMAEVVVGRKNIQRCSICGDWEDLTGRSTRWERHTRCYDRRKKQLQRSRKGEDSNGGND